MPGIYTKLLDVDKVDLVVGGYATNEVAPAMPVVMRKGKTFISLFALDVNAQVQISEILLGAADRPEHEDFVHRGLLPGRQGAEPASKTVALAAADAEFSQNACEGARENAKKCGFKIVYDKSYPPPPKTTDFTPIVRALQAANADIVVVCSYPADSVGIVEAANEIGLKPKMFGGAMVGLQVTAFKEKLKGKLNGLVNYETWVPDEKQMYKGTEDFFKEYQARAKARRRRSARLLSRRLGLRLRPDPRRRDQGRQERRRRQARGLPEVAQLRDHHGPDQVRREGRVGRGPDAHGAVPRHQAGRRTSKTWRGMSYQTVLAPKNLATGKLIFPYEKAHQ